MAFAEEHEFIALRVHAHGQMGRLAIFRLGLTGELAACRDNLLRASDDIGHLKAQAGPGAFAFTTTMDADDAFADADFADDIVLLEHGAAKDGGVEMHRTAHVGCPDDVFESFDYHAALLAAHFARRDCYCFWI